MASAQPFTQRYEDVILRLDRPSWIACADPKAWAQYRGHLTKTVPWFRNAQGGVCMTTNGENSAAYSKTKYITGILIDRFSPDNSYFDAEVIITGIHNPQKEPTKDAERRCNAIRPTREEKRLVGCLIGKGAAQNAAKLGKRAGSLFPCPMPNNQNCWVLDFYVITDDWKAYVEVTEIDKQGEENVEKQVIKEVRMVRLERWKLEEKAWFANPDSSHNPPALEARDFTITADEEECLSCHKLSPRMFKEYFLCRNEKCDDHWKHDGKLSTAKLTYEKSYLQQREKGRPDGFSPYGAYNGTLNFPEIAPNFPEWWHENWQQYEEVPLTKENSEMRMKALNAGFLCPNCGMINERKRWHEWKCANSTCSFVRPGYPKISTAGELAQIHKTAQPVWKELSCFAGVDSTGDYMRYNFDLKHGCGITVIVPKEGSDAQRQSDWLLKRFQDYASDGDILLEKQFIGTRVPGMVTNHFVHNYGRSYKLAIDVRQDTPFRDAPKILPMARDAANKLCRQYQSEEGTEDFNQCYVAAYFADNAMHFHSDGEKGLGSVIATWTLGGDGEMLIAPNDHQFFGWEGSKPLQNDLLLPGIRAEPERRRLKADLDRRLEAVKGAAQKEEEVRGVYRRRFREVVKEWEGKGSAGARPAPLLKLPLTHGSVVVMHGKNMQNYYQHEVSVKSPLRFALTFRHVAKDNEGEKGADERATSAEYPHTPDRSYLSEFLGGVKEGKGGDEKRSKR